MGFRGLMWWVDRWRASAAFSDLTLEEQGAYRNLLDAASLRGGTLPNDERLLAKECGDATRWRKVRAKVLAKFTVGPDGLLRNGTLTKVIAESSRRAKNQKAYRDRHRGGGNDNGTDNAGDNAGAHGPANGTGHRAANEAANGAANGTGNGADNRADSLDLDQEHVQEPEHTLTPLPRRTTPVHLLREPEFETALAIIHGVIEADPNGSESSWRAGAKEVCLQQGWNYAARHADHESPLIDRALAAAIATRKQRAAKAAMRPQPRAVGGHR